MWHEVSYRKDALFATHQSLLSLSRNEAMLSWYFLWPPVGVQMISQQSMSQSPGNVLGLNRLTWLHFLFACEATWTSSRGCVQSGDFKQTPEYKHLECSDSSRGNPFMRRKCFCIKIYGGIFRQTLDSLSKLVAQDVATCGENTFNDNWACLNLRSGSDVTTFNYILESKHFQMVGHPGHPKPCAVFKKKAFHQIQAICAIGNEICLFCNVLSAWFWHAAIALPENQ